MQPYLQQGTVSPMTFLKLGVTVPKMPVVWLYMFFHDDFPVRTSDKTCTGIERATEVTYEFCAIKTCLSLLREFPFHSPSIQWGQWEVFCWLPGGGVETAWGEFLSLMCTCTPHTSVPSKARRQRRLALCFVQSLWRLVLGLSEAGATDPIIVKPRPFLILCIISFWVFLFAPSLKMKIEVEESSCKLNEAKKKHCLGKPCDLKPVHFVSVSTAYCMIRPTYWVVFQELQSHFSFN